jgi:hypothetical protein
MLTAVLVVLWLGGCGSDNAPAVGPVEDTTPPLAPARLRVERIGDGEIWLNWALVAEVGVTYRVYRREGDGPAAVVDTTAEARFGDIGLDYATEYAYQVTAVDAAGNEGPASNPAGGQPLNNLAPLPPEALRAVAHNLVLLSRLEIALDWDANSETDLVAYRVYRSTVPGEPVSGEHLRAVVGRPRFVDEEVTVGTTYYYRVTGVDRGGKESLASGEASDVPLPLPELEAPVQGTLTSATPVFRWRPVPGARSYQVVVTTSPTTGEISAIPATGDTIAAFVGRPLVGGGAEVLRSGEIYYWRVAASTRADRTENSVSLAESFKVN